MAVDVEIGVVAVHPLANEICQPAHRQNVARAVKGEGIIGLRRSWASTLSLIGIKPTVLGLKGMALRCVCARHYFDHTAGKCWKSQTFIKQSCILRNLLTRDIYNSPRRSSCFCGLMNQDTPGTGCLHLLRGTICVTANPLPKRRRTPPRSLHSW